jgi:hypothetical protein
MPREREQDQMLEAARGSMVHFIDKFLSDHNLSRDLAPHLLEMLDFFYQEGVGDGLEVSGAVRKLSKKT